jgi:hypothetical protein
MRQHDGILQSHACSVTEIRSGGMGRIAQQTDAAAGPAAERRTIDDIVLHDCVIGSGCDDGGNRSCPIPDQF